MIGVYNYTVYLTYISLLSGVVGSYLSLGCGRLYAGMICLMVSGLCDAFDGRVARTKKDRTDLEKGFGIQIDSLTDIVAFGVTPACLAATAFRTSSMADLGFFRVILILSIPALYVLAAMIRLAYFNVVEEERQKKEGGAGHSYIGLPVTAAALIFPTILIIQRWVGVDLTVLYFIAMLITAMAFVSMFHVKKPGLKGILVMVAIGAVELAVFIVRHWYIK